MTETLREIAEYYAIGSIGEEDVTWLLQNKYNEGYKSFVELPAEFHDYVDIRRTQLWVEEQDDAEILEALRNCE